MAWGRKPRRALRSSGRSSDAAEPSHDAGAARMQALAVMARRDHGSRELAGKLAERGFAVDLVATLIEELQDERLLDDARYVEHFVAAHARRGHGPMRIRQDLRQLKVAEELISQALTGPDWATVCREVRVRKFSANIPADWAEKTRQARFLQYRGFSSDHIRLALGPDVDADL